MHKFNFARQLAAIAAEADELDKAMLTPHELRQLELCRDVMLTTAQEFAGDLGCDSLDIVELAMHLEDEFGINIDDDRFAQLSTVQHVIDHVQQLTEVTP